MIERRILAEIDGRSGYAGLVALFRARIAEWGVSMDDVGEMAGLPLRYVHTLLADAPLKHFGPTSFGPLLSTLRMKLLAVDDEAADYIIMRGLNKLKARSTHGPKLDARVDARVKKQRKGRVAQVKWLLVTSAKQRSNIARYAASCRWKEHNRLKARRLRRKVRDKLMNDVMKGEPRC